ncbi:MAG: hypothetical protein HUU55_18680 [Myxococcales bacterium]|nr:hypothetical protein [Myxococcales bacterium]
MDQKTKGAWLLHHMFKLQRVTNTPEYENIATAGKVGLLLSGLSASEDSSLTRSQVAAIAHAAGLSTLELPELLRLLVMQRLIDQGKSGSIAVLGVTSPAVLTHTATIFDAQAPSPVECAALDFAEIVSSEPRYAPFVQQFLADTYKLSRSETTPFLDHCEQIGFVDAESLDATQRLYFNGNLFRRDQVAKTKVVLDTLTSSQGQTVRDFEVQVRQNGCVQRDLAERVLTPELFRRLLAIGMYDLNEVSNTSESMSYVTLPAAFSKFGSSALIDDALDLAKAFVACLSYGMHRSNRNRGRISMLHTLMAKLIAGQWVGPATAIGEDYKVLEFKRVIEVRQEPPAFSMRLLKKEVGELALRVLTDGDTSDVGLLGFPASPVTKYTRPEDSRALVRKQQVPVSKKATAEMLLAIRAGGVK